MSAARGGQLCPQPPFQAALFQPGPNSYWAGSSAAIRISGKIYRSQDHERFKCSLAFRLPDGIERFDDAWNRRVEKHGFPIANIDDIVGSKQAANRQKDKDLCRGCYRSGSG